MRADSKSVSDSKECESLSDEVVLAGGLAHSAGAGLIDADADLHATEHMRVGRRGFTLLDSTQGARCSFCRHKRLLNSVRFSGIFY